MDLADLLQKHNAVIEAEEFEIGDLALMSPGELSASGVPAGDAMSTYGSPGMASATEEERRKLTVQEVPGAVEEMRRLAAGSALSRWVWLNALLDARNPEYRAALPAVLKAVTEFIRRVLATHPLYARRR